MKKYIISFSFLALGITLMGISLTKTDIILESGAIIEGGFAYGALALICFIIFGISANIISGIKMLKKPQNSDKIVFFSSMLLSMLILFRGVLIMFT